MISFAKGISRSLLLLLTVLWYSPATAATDPVITNALSGSAGQIIVNAQLLSTDQTFYLYPSSIEQTFSRRNMVSLGIDEASPNYILTDFTVSINLRITKTRPDNTDSIFEKVLTIDYKKASGQKFNALQYVVFANGAKVKAEVLSINTNGASWDVTKVLIIKNEITVTRDYNFNCSTLITGLSLGYEFPALPKQDEVIASWVDPGNGQTEYDLEWTWVEESAWPLFQTAGVFDPVKVFDANTTRVTVPLNSYKIPLLYDGVGKLFARVRPAQLKESRQRVEGTWSYTATGVSGNMVAFDFNGHEDSLNWQSSTTFAEDGKRKSVIQYFDGTLRGRQTVTKDNVTGNVVVAETFYDYQGRPMIQVLPAPTLNTIIQYAGNFNRFVNEVDYPKSLYDKLNPNEGICIKPAMALSNSSGTGNYYSASNSFLALPPGDTRKSNFDKFIPDGGGYPFTETRYTPDATGRVATQSGVGEVYKLGSGHETKYFYESPDQNELDALFGTDAGVASHYFKNLVRDANGQYSVSYVDMHGRTVATALAGGSPESLQQLSSYSNRSITKNLLDKETNNIIGKSVISSKSIVVPAAGNYVFNYQLSPEKLQLLNCNDQQICYDCYYDLVITIVSDCGEPVVIPGKSNPYVVRNFTLNEYLSNCSSNGGMSPGFAESLTVPLAEGSYTVTKELKLNTEAQNYYRDNVFLNNNTCKTLQDFIDEEYELLQAQTNCNITCESCTEALGEYSDFRDRFIQQAGTLTTEELTALEPQLVSAYNEAKANCDRLCDAVNNDGFDAIRSIREIMLTDVTPLTGQYAKLDTDGSSTIRNMKYNIFSTTDANGYEMLVQSPPDYKFPQEWNSSTNTVQPGAYKDQNGNTDPVNAQLTTITAETFASSFQSSWAEALLPHHPEYCKLITTERFLKPAYQFEASMNKTETWQLAATAGYIQNLLNLDPFFANASSPGYAYRATMQSKMQLYSSGLNCSGTTAWVSMWQVAQASVFCMRKDPNCISPDNQTDCLLAQAVTPPNNPSTGCATDWDYVWKNYRSMYLSQRKMLIAQYINSQCGNINNADISSYGYIVRFPDLASNNAPLTEFPQLNNLFTALNNNNIPGATAAGDNLMAEQADITCRSYALMWITRLKECPATATAMTAADEAWIIDNLVQICKGGFDINHLQGSSSLPAGTASIVDPVYNVSYREFPDVVLKFLQLKNIPVSALCHPWQIEFPKPYDKSPALTNAAVITTPTDCECTQLSNLQFEYQQTGFAGSFSQWLEYRHGTYITQGALDTLTALCNKTYSCNYLPAAIQLPPVLQCKETNTEPVKTCITCQEYQAIRTSFTSTFGGAAPYPDPQNDTEQQLNHAFEYFANYQTGFNKHWYEYVAFGQQCDSLAPIPCASLDSVVQLFHQQYPAPGTGTECRQLFTQFFNTAFGTFYTFDQIVTLYLQSCGTAPDVCKPTLSCKEFKQHIQDFYIQYGVTVYQNSNCSNLFTTYMNQQLQSNYTYTQLENLYQYLCGCSLNICSFPNCFLLSQVHDDFKLEYGSEVWAGGNCQNLFVSYFNAYFNFEPGTYNYAAIQGFYQTCFSSGCGPDISQLCLPPYSCSTLQQLVYNFLALGQSGNCQDLFTTYFNQQLGTTFTYSQIANIYQSVCGAAPAVCSPVYNCAGLQLVMTNFKEDVVFTSANCQSLFTQYFNTHYGTSLSYTAIQSLYLTHCGSAQMVCDETIVITSGTQLQQALSSFKAIYPDPGVQLGDTCQQTFRNYFNSYFGTNFSDSLIAAYYKTLCGEELNICATNCSIYTSFITDFNSKYSGLVIPSSIRQQLFTYLFNQAFPPNNDNQTYLVIKAMLSACLSGGEPVPDDGITYSAWNAPVLLSMKQVYYQLHPGGLPVDCQIDFTSWFNLAMGTSFDYNQLMTRYETVIGTGAGTVCGGEVQKETPIGGGSSPYQPPLLCGLNDPVFTPAIVNNDPCKDLYKLALNRAEERYQLYIDSLRNVFDAAYLAKCLSAKDLEIFTVTHSVAEYHYTLYYYDQAGLLVKTVPPAGVDARHGDAGFLNNVKTARANVLAGQAMSANYVVPSHTLTTQYRYNTLGQVVQQQSPDGGLSKFWYDRLGRLVVSQNAQQALDGKYSYTVYDGLGRIQEVGQKPQVTLMTQATSRSESALNAWLNSTTNKEQITRTVYDLSYFDGDAVLHPQHLSQRNLRNRVSYTQVFDAQPGSYVGTHRAATYYTYDIHGNVDTLLQDYNSGAMQSTGNRYKKIAYNYDLVSGKVNNVIYQPDYFNTVTGAWATPVDQFYHRYEYDLENKLTTVLTSHDGWVWEKEARYSYYKHGPLARANLGQQQVQGIDYAYTLQGWLKGVNSTAISEAPKEGCAAGTAESVLNVTSRQQYDHPANYVARLEINFDPTFESDWPDNFTAEINNSLQPCVPTVLPSAYVNGDMGQDGKTGSPNFGVARDAYSFSLNYYQATISGQPVSDYKPISVADQPFAGGMFSLTNTETQVVAKPLFNGNIASLFVNLPKLGAPQLYGYQYDQLNRIVGMDAFGGFNATTNGWESSGPVATANYKERVSYDPNGNILTYNRNGFGATTAMDNLSYGYNKDVNNQLINNRLRHVKDAIGDANYTEDIDNQPDDNYDYDAIGNLIKDTKEGITAISWSVYGKILSITKASGTISYTYDASGNRISKTANAKTTWYVRDASGNVMSIYETGNPAVNSGQLTQTEVHLYGSSRLGIFNLQRNVQTPEVNTTGVYTFIRGNKFFELSNHLGNVLVTVSDRRLQLQSTTNTTLVEGYVADVLNAGDYYPFGMGMPGRKFSADGAYRYGFNGKERDKDMNSLTAYDYGFRIYNPAIGKFLSVDPLTSSYPWYTPYQFAGNKPIWCIDLDGLEEALPKQPPKIPQLTNVSESTCIGCVERIKMIQIHQTEVNLEKLKKEYEAWRTSDPANIFKPVPPQYIAVAPKPTKSPSVGVGGFYGSKEYKLAKANYDTYGQYLPGPSDIVDGLTAIKELSNGNYEGAAAAAFFLIPGADVFKPIKALKGVGGELLEGYLKKFGNQADHLTKLDIEGALKDIAKTPILKKSGVAWQHLKEVEEALSGVGNQLEKLTKDINAGKFTDEVLKQAETIRGTLQKQKDKLTDVLNEAKKNAQE